MDAAWQASRLKWGFELADGTRVTNVDLFPWQEHLDHEVDPDWVPSRPVLSGGGGGGNSTSVDRDQWLWPLPPPGPLRVVCQWPEHDVPFMSHDLDAQLVRDAEERSRPLWRDPDA